MKMRVITRNDIFGHNYCKSHLSVGSGARNDLTRHAKSQNHMQLEMVQRIHRIQIRF